MIKHLRNPLAAGLILLGCIQAYAQSSQQTWSPPAVKGFQMVLGSLRAANFNVTTDQAIPIYPNITAYQITAIVVANCSISMTTAAGGFYPATSKGGTAIVAAGQVYSSLTASTVLLSTTVAATPLVTRYTVSGTPNVYLSLTTPQGAAATCDAYVIGNDLS